MSSHYRATPVTSTWKSPTITNRSPLCLAQFSTSTSNSSGGHLNVYNLCISNLALIKCIVIEIIGRYLHNSTPWMYNERGQSTVAVGWRFPYFRKGLLSKGGENCRHESQCSALASWMHRENLEGGREGYRGLLTRIASHFYKGVCSPLMWWQSL